MATIIMSKEAKRVYMAKRTPKRDNIKPHSKTNNYYEPIARGCAFPDKANPQIKRGRATPNIHKMYRFARIAPKMGFNP